METALIQRAWSDPTRFACDADRLALHANDFADRLLGVVAGYLRWSGENAERPTLAAAEAVLRSFAVPHGADELFLTLIDTPASSGDDLADLIIGVIRAANDRSERLCRAVTREALKVVKHAFECPVCRACRNNPAERRFASPRARKTIRRNRALRGRVVA